MLGAMLRHNQNLSQQENLTKALAREKLIQERRERMNQYDEMNKPSNNDGIIEKILSMSVGTSLFVGSINKLINGFESSNITDKDSATKFLSNFDKTASKEDIDNLLDLIVNQMKEFDDRRFKFDLESYQYNNVYNDLDLQKQLQEQNNRVNIIAKNNQINERNSRILSDLDR